MIFVKNEKINIVVCDKCQGTGFLQFRNCPNCKKMHAGFFYNNLFIYFGQSLTLYNIKLHKARKILNFVRILSALVFWLGFWALLVYSVWQTDKNINKILTASFWFDGREKIRILFWLGFVAMTYLFYRITVQNPVKKDIDYNFLKKNVDKKNNITATNWLDIKKISHKNKFDFSNFLTENTNEVLQQSFLFARSKKNSEITPLHIFYTLLSSDEIIGIFVRLGISIQNLKSRVGLLISKTKKTDLENKYFGDDFWQIIFNTFVISANFKDISIRTSELLLATVRQSESLQEILYDLGVENQKLDNVVEWVRNREYFYDQYRKFRRAASGVSKYGMDKAMTSVATPFMNAYSKDLTLFAKYGHLSQCVAREKEIEEIFNIIEAGSENVILVGEHGVGKMAIIEGIVQKMISGEAPKKLLDKRFVQISTSSLMAGTTVAGAQQRLIKIMNEVSHAKNIILFINNLHDLTGMNSGQGGQSMDVSETLAEYLSSGNFTMFATSLPEGYNRHIVNSEIGTVFAKVSISEMNADQAISVLESKAGEIEYKNKIFFSYDSLAKCVTLTDKFFFDQNLPASAIALLLEVGNFVKNKKGQNTLVFAEDVAEVVANKTGIPVASITENESDKLMRLEQEMHKHVVGQDLAVELVSNALRRARAEIRSQKRPIANFLFLGPTGVGKTELAKTIAEVYFGGEDKMIRMDMSEYQDTNSIYRMIGQPGQQGTGLLTEAVRQKPFSLVLLDELEKANKDVLNLFLQVFDDGRLTDSVGRVIDFTSTIIIATSNAGTSYVQSQMNNNVDLDTIKNSLIHGELMQYYRPEFLNRFDGIVLFKALNREEIKQIAGLMLKSIAKDLEARGVELRVEDSALEALADVGFDPEFGARPMRRAIQDRIENRLAELILQNKLQRRDTIILGDACQISVKHG
ncbi:MAG: ATP-dependent Clp protease ATP-binding subunit [Candidatus Magasanikbacteria bacterium]